MELKLHEIVERAGLNLSTAQYVLKHEEYLKGMPDAGSQGVHRIFDDKQAYRLALCSLLIVGGIPLKHAGSIVEFCLRKTMSRGGFQFIGVQPMVFWSIEIYDAKYFRIRGEDATIPSDSNQMYLVDGQRAVRTPVGCLVQVTIDLVRLRRCILRNT